MPHYIIGIALGAGIFGMFMLCEGFMVPRDSIPDYWIWAYYLGFHSYSFQSFVYKQFSVELPSLEAKAVLKSLDMDKLDDHDIRNNMIILAGYAIVLQLCFFGILYRFHTGRR